VGAIGGGIVGFFLGVPIILIWEHLCKPKARRIAVREVPTNFGTLYKINFEFYGMFKGYYNPGVCQFEIKVDQRVIIGKWDEMPNPLKEDNLREFEPALVPTSYYLNLFPSKRYLIPVLHEENKKFSIFSAWWFGNDKGYDAGPDINNQSKIEVLLIGTGFTSILYSGSIESFIYLVQN